MDKQSFYLVESLSLNECVNIYGGAEGDAAKGLGAIIGAIGGFFTGLVDAYLKNVDSEMSETLMNCI